jgi:DNA polymerase-3 subunit gamma/tau
MIELADQMQARSLSFEGALQEIATLLHRLALIQQIAQVAAPDDPDHDRVVGLAQRFAAPDLQLYYQIAVQGRADLWLAPDEYAGFTMALLRMLAFAPADQSAAPAQPAGSAPTTPRAAAPGRPAAKAPAAGGGAPQRSAVAAQPVQDWPVLVASLKLGGMARMLAQHCELIRADASRMELRLPEAHRHLLEKTYRDKLQAALEERFERRIVLEIALGEATGTSPAALEDQERQARQRQAVESIDRDPFVRELVENFDARVADESIRPVDSRPAG